VGLDPALGVRPGSPVDVDAPRARRVDDGPIADAGTNRRASREVSPPSSLSLPLGTR
jgi:hypothetical protein